MRLKIIRFEPTVNAFFCKWDDDSGYVDILVDGGIPFDETKSDKEFYQSLVGKEVECSRMHAFVSIAHDVKLID